MIPRIRLLVSLPTPGFSFKTMETVAVETFALFAMSLMVIRSLTLMSWLRDVRAVSEGAKERGATRLGGEGGESQDIRGTVSRANATRSPERT
jgi:hypothetical protein